jgi:hypothetical protein
MQSLADSISFSPMPAFKLSKAILDWDDADWHDTIDVT